MSATTLQGSDKVGTSNRLATFRRELVAAVVVGITALPNTIAAGMIVFAPLGPDFVAAGVAAALYAAIFGGIVTAMIASSTFVVSFPFSSLAAVQVGLASLLLANPIFAARPSLALPAIALSVLLSGVFVILIGLSGLTRIIKYTPHTVLAGFRNGISATIIWLQVKAFIDMSGQQSGVMPFVISPTQVAAIALLTMIILQLHRVTTKVPAPLLGLLIGVAAFYGFRWLGVPIDIGGTIGPLPFTFPPQIPLLQALDTDMRSALISALPAIVQMSLVTAAFASLQSLLVYRLAQNLDDAPVNPPRDLAGLGIGNCVSALVGGIALQGASGQTGTAYRNGGRTRLVGILIGVMFLALSLGAPWVIAGLPIFAVSAVIIQNAIGMFDGWSTGLLRKTLRERSSPERRRAWYDLAVVAAVMLFTLLSSVMAGVAVGIALACVVFILNMSRPLIRRQLTGTTLASKRLRSLEDSAHLRETGSRRAIIEINGVLFFGNTEALSDEVTRLFPQTEMILLDCRGVVDIDASGSAILRTLAERARKQRRQVLFCNVPAAFAGQFAAIAKHGQQPAPFTDLDTALEWMEEKALSTRPAVHGATAELQLDQHDFVRGLDPAELSTFSALLSPQTFPAAATLCKQGEAGDRMWLLTRGSVSIRIETADAHRGTRRLASLAQGTTVGEMALIEDGRRTATIVANEDIACLELSKAAYREILERHPAIAAKLFGNLLREMASRIRDNHVDLRETVG